MLSPLALQDEDEEEEEEEEEPFCVRPEAGERALWSRPPPPALSLCHRPLWLARSRSDEFYS